MMALHAVIDQYRSLFVIFFTRQCRPDALRLEIDSVYISPCPQYPNSSQKNKSIVQKRRLYVNHFAAVLLVVAERLTGSCKKK